MIYDLDGNALDAHYGSDGNKKPYAYDVVGNIMFTNNSGDASELRDSTIVTNVYTSPNISAISQGGCIDDENNVYTIFYQAGIFAKYGLITGVETSISFTGGAYGHANGMTYNPDTGYLYVASMNNSGEVYVFNKSMELVDTKYARDAIGIRYAIFNIAYDRNQHLFVSFMDKPSGALHYYDNDFNHVVSFNIDPTFWTNTSQDIETDGKYIYYVSSGPNVIHVTSLEGEYLKTIDNSDFSGEPESMMYNWETGEYYMETFGKWTIRHLEIKSQ